MRVFPSRREFLRKLDNKNNSFCIKIDDIEDHTGGLNNWIEEKLNRVGLEPELVNRILIVCAEIEANIINHAYPDEKAGKEKTMEVCLSFSKGGVEIRFIDKGTHFDPLSIENKPETNFEQGGRGLPIIKKIPDKISYKRIDDSKNELSLYFFNKD